MRQQIIMSVLSFCLLALPAIAAASAICPTKIYVRKDGAIFVDGKIYSDTSAVRARFRNIVTGHSGCAVSFVADKDAPYKAIAQLITVFQELGVVKIGFLTEPKNLAEPPRH